MKISNKVLYVFSIPAVVTATGGDVFAQVYLTMEQAQQLIFPGETFTPMPLILTDTQCREIKSKCGISVRVKEIKAWKTSAGDYFIVDEVVGKHEFITYAVGLSHDGSVRQIEIMDYRETYGYEVRNEDWRKQFVGKTSQAPLKLDADIKNISGATLSCKHVTDGVKRTLGMYEVALKK